MEKINLQELEEAAKPLIELLTKKGESNIKVMVGQGGITLQCFSLPYTNKD